MILEIVSTGEEVLSGQIVDTNASWISAELSEQGLEIARRFTVGDRMPDLVNLFLERSKIADVVIVTGGLGPTSDDLTSKAISQAKGEPLRLFPEWWDELIRRFAKNGRPLDPQNIQQATLPDSATIFDNPIGTACGFKVAFNKSNFYFLPGVPSEMKKMFTGLILPEILAINGSNSRIDVDVFQTFGVSESTLGRMLSSITLPQSINLGYRPQMPTVEVKMISRDASVEDKERVAGEIRRILADKLYSTSDQTLAAKVQELMIERGLTLATAESCTGGMLSSKIIDIAGSSQYFDRGYVCYSNRSKSELLGIASALIDAHGAVSVEVALSMAVQARKLAGVSVALAISGVAGPDGGTPEKPVGTVAFALATPEKDYCQFLALPAWGRQRVREISVAIALDMLRRYIIGYDVTSASIIYHR